MRRAAFLLSFVFAVGAVLFGVAGWAHGAPKPRVLAVLYFDNNTADRELDVLQKGLADMLITDLAERGVTVVEREKLQALLDEMKLQRTRFFDDKLALRLGKGLGATHAVAGSFTVVKLTARLDVRLIDVQSGRVVLATKVSGKADEVFNLEQSLVASFLAKLQATAETPALPRTRVPSLKALLTYSKGIDLADRKELEPARDMLALAIEQAPAFGLAPLRRDEILKRLERARAHRETTASEINAEILAKADAILRGKPIRDLGKAEARQHLAYRIARGRLLCLGLAAHLSATGPNVVLPGHARPARALVRAIYDNGRLLIDELGAYAAAHTETLPNGQTYLQSSFDLPEVDEVRLDKARIGGSFSLTQADARRVLAGFILEGICDAGAQRLLIGPTPADLEPTWRKPGHALLASAWAAFDAQRATGTYGELQAIATLEAQADALLLEDNRDAAIAKLQEILDRYPTASNYAVTEARIKREAGISHDSNVEDLTRYAQGLRTCDDMDLRIGIHTLSRRARRLGLEAPRLMVAEIEKACRGKAPPRFWPYLYTSMALFAGGHGDCAQFEAWIERATAAGLSKSDLEGYRRNYTRCPPPPQP